jgi:hypothetical protein
MVSDLGNLKAREPLVGSNPKVPSKNASKRERKKLEKVSQTMGQVAWTMDDSHKNLKLSNVGMDLWKGIDSNIISHVDLEKFFGKQTQNVWKSKPNDHSTIANCSALLKLCEDVYDHPFDNGQYSVIFLKGWLAHCNSHRMN